MQNNGLSNIVRFLVVMAAFMAAWYYLYPKRNQQPDEADAPKLPNITREQAAAVASPAILGGKPFNDLLPGRLPKPVEPPKPAVAAPSAPTEPQAFIALGDDSFALKVLLTNHGAGVQQLILTKFEEANRRGTKVIDDKGKARPLFLIPGLVRTQFLYIADDSEPFELPSNLTAADFAAGKKPGKLPATDRLSAPSYTLLHYPAKDDPLRPVDKDGKIRPEDDRIPLATLAERDWKIASVKQPADGPWEVVFETDLPAPYYLKLRKTFSLDRTDYDFKMKVDIVGAEGRLKGAGKFRYQIAGAVGMPIEGEWYTTSFRTAYTGWLDGNGTPRREIDDASNIHYRHGGDVLEKPGRFTFAAEGTQYFASALAIDDDVTVNDQPWEYVRPTRELHPDTNESPEKQRQSYEQERYFLFDITTRAVTKVFDPAKDEQLSHAYAVYNGPMKVRLLSQLKGDRAVPQETVDRYVSKYHLDTLTDYHSPTWFGRRLDGIGWTSLIIFTTNTMHWLLGVLHGLVGSWGFAIMLVTVCVRLCLFIPSRRQQTINAHMSARILALKPQLDKLQEKYKDDFLAHAQAKKQLFAQAGINQFSQMGGCVLLLLQMPILMGLYFCLQESVFFRLEPFLWFPNLAAPDMTIPWTESIPMVSTPWSRFGSLNFLYLGPFFNILPLFAVVLFYVQQRLTMPPPTDDIQAQQQQIMKYMLVFTALFFFKVAAGLCVYFIVGGLWAILERRLVPKPDITKAQAVAVGAHVEKALPGRDRDSGGNGTDEPKTQDAKPAGFWGRMKVALEEAQRQAETQRQIRNDKPNGAGGEAQPPRASAAERAQERKNKKKRK
ncbi:membrane protein insertase YidC [Limnoglobus roseus]|uniref:Membrane protein insertase YidC n=1 Tax=Limnoglobus roseus TaxID=2598579 RepID=A0A5C1AGS1_9BACT|nr:membrane protein insertase YidC [Limnoglobus roseus]QEL16942.1 Membrane protein insertase YidC [Limnoglobus roseus]